ncbi:MAG: hypothetical protein ABF289_10970 [Clostridiales bacterium]
MNTISACECIKSDEIEKKKLKKEGSIKIDNLQAVKKQEKHLFDYEEVSVYIYKKTIDKYKANYDILAEECYMIGITNIYLSFSNNEFKKSDEYSNEIHKLIKEFHNKGIKVSALSFQDSSFYYNEYLLYETLLIYNKFNSQTNDIEERFDEISADLEPHILKESKKSIPNTYPYRWNTKNGYGIGMANDNLMKQTLKILEEVKNLNSDIVLSESIGHFFHKHALNGDMEVGTVNDFLKICDKVIIMAYSNEPEKVIKFSEDELMASNKEKSIVIGIKTSINTFGGEGSSSSMNNNNRNDFINKVTTIMDSCDKYKSFRGIAFFEFDGLKQILDKN